MSKFKSGDKVIVGQDAPQEWINRQGTVIWPLGKRASRTGPGVLPLPLEDEWELTYAIILDGDRKWVPIRESWL